MRQLSRRFKPITPKAFADSSPFTECIHRLSEVTPKAFASFSPWLERQPWDHVYLSSQSTLKGLGLCGNNPDRVQPIIVVVFPRLSLHSNLGLKLANAFGVQRSPPSKLPTTQTKILWILCDFVVNIRRVVYLARLRRLSTPGSSESP